MTFLELQEAVMANSRFRESQRGDIKTWINARYWWLWSLEDWPFRYATDTLTVTAGSQSVSSVPADFGKAVALVPTLSGQRGSKLRYLTPGRFFADYYDPAGDEGGDPAVYTIVNGTLFVAPTPDAAATDYKLVYLKEWAELSADENEPALPTGAHLSLVFGAAATGLKLEQDPGWQAFDQDFNSAIQILRAGYLHDQADLPDRWPADDLS